LVRAGLVVVAEVGVLELCDVLLPVGLAAKRGLKMGATAAKRQTKGTVVLFIVFLG
jgi:hypothetical protein